jgi:hypothetical protein
VIRSETDDLKTHFSHQQMLPTLLVSAAHPPRTVQRAKVSAIQCRSISKMYGERFELVSAPFQGRLIARWFK